MFRTLLTSNNRVRMNSNTADIIIHMLQIDNIGTLLEVMSEEQAKDIATAVKNAARNLPDALRAPSFTINVNIPVDAAVDEDRRRELLDAAIAQAEQAEQTRITNQEPTLCKTWPLCLLNLLLCSMQCGIGQLSKQGWDVK